MILQKKLSFCDYAVEVLEAHQGNTGRETSGDGDGGPGRAHSTGRTEPWLEEVTLGTGGAADSASLTRTTSAGRQQRQPALPLPPAATPETIACAYCSEPESMRLPPDCRAAQDAAAVQARRAAGAVGAGGPAAACAPSSPQALGAAPHWPLPLRHPPLPHPHPLRRRRWLRSRSCCSGCWPRRRRRPAPSGSALRWRCGMR